jgi:hypothetical protein
LIIIKINIAIIISVIHAIVTIHLMFDIQETVVSVTSFTEFSAAVATVLVISLAASVTGGTTAGTTYCVV